VPQPNAHPLAVLARVLFGAGIVLVSVAVLRPSVASQNSDPATTASARVGTSAAATTTSTLAPRPTPTTFSLDMSDADLTTAAASGFPQTVSGVTVTDPKVAVASAGVRLTASAKVFFGTTQFAMAATPTVVDGHIAVRVDSATLAGLALPDSTRASIADSVQSTIARLIPANVRVTSVTFAPGRLTVLGTQP
jgi:hypothetical protein